MRRLLVLLAVAAIATCAVPAMAALTYDFEDGMQGWQWYYGPDSRIPYADGEWIAPTGPAPELVPGVYGTTGGNLFCTSDGASRAIAYLDLADVCVGGSTQSFFLQADVYIPNLQMPGSFWYDYPGNMNHYSGIGALPIGTEWGTWVWGQGDKGAQVYMDYTSEDWIPHRAEWIMEDWTGGSYQDPLTWWDQWITISLDWNYSVAGNVTAKAYIPWEIYNGSTGWKTIYDGAIEDSTWQPRPINFDRIMLGSNVTTAATPWTKSQWDNVIFDSPDLIPEPGSFAALGVGLVGLLGVIRRRK